MEKQPVGIQKLFAIGVVLSMTMALPASAQVVDLTTAIADSSDPVNPGTEVTFTVDASNIGNTESNAVTLDVYLPSGVPASMTDYLANEPLALELVNATNVSAEVSANIWNPENSVTGIWIDDFCEYFLLQAQNLEVIGGVTGTLTYDITAPSLPTTDGALHVTSGYRDTNLDFGRGGCDTALACDTHPCMGSRLSLIAPVQAALELVNDGSSNPSEGCSSLNGFTPGRIALIDRGTCSFETKALNAYNVGAIGAVIADNDDVTDMTVEPDDTIDMSCTNYCDQTVIPIPMAFVSWTNSQIFHEELVAGPVQVTMGQRDTGGVLTTKAFIWQDPGAGYPADVNLDNNIAYETTQVGSLFSDGFEDGSTQAWSDTSG